METYLHFFVIRTAIPLGYIFIFLFLVVLSLVSISLTIRSFLPGRKLWHRIGYIGLIYVSLVFWVNYQYSKKLDLNAHGVTISELSGAWVDGESRLLLNSDSTFEFLISENYSMYFSEPKVKGKWVIDQSNIIFNAMDAKIFVPFRVIKYDKDYRIIAENFNDPDMWDGNLGFKKIKKGV